MSRKIAIPLEGGLLCPHFGHCQQFAIVETSEDQILSQQLLTPPPHEPGLFPAWLAGHGVSDVIAGGMGQRAIQLFNDQCINVYTGAPLHQPVRLVNDFLAGKLMLTANYCDHDSHGGHHQCRQ
ncbi:MAG TPA: NifB/NifX family molybdenum-iron cluster-binding protein [Bacteroidales bacterium]|nr:NifB/NifX family molybdenum-iron cluster-binding protein [Bacteroidales bacterium]HSA43010.1 NifB/NifX family molybdenum-iron cluster-binding protein [Bacteroidales bacterium]